MTHQRKLGTLTALFALVLAVTPAQAHTGHDGLAGFLPALLHPMSGVDHVLAALAAGSLASLGGARGSRLALAYLGGLVAAVLFPMNAPPPGLETGLAASVLVLGLLGFRALGPLGPISIATGLLAGALHGAAHGVDVIGGGDSVTAAAGLALSTAVLIVGGMQLGRRLQQRGVHRHVVAWPMAAAGAALLARTFG